MISSNSIFFERFNFEGDDAKKGNKVREGVNLKPLNAKAILRQAALKGGPVVCFGKTIFSYSVKT